MSGDLVTFDRSRRSAKRMVSDLITALAESCADEGRHVHVTEPAASWCLTSQPAGYLYARLGNGRN